MICLCLYLHTCGSLISWTINTKYYTAEVSLWMAHLHDEFSIANLCVYEYPQALVMVFDMSDVSLNFLLIVFLALLWCLFSKKFFQVQGCNYSSIHYDLTFFCSFRLLLRLKIGHLALIFRSSIYFCALVTRWIFFLVTQLILNTEGGC